MTESSRPVGVLDSGLGGLSVLRALRAELPGEDFVVCADCAHAPWGEKSPDYIRARCRAIAEFLLSRGCRAAVLACNTATAHAADALRQWMPVPVIGIEPAVRPAARRTRSGVIGVLATPRTIESQRYRSLVERFAQGVRVLSVPAPGLMERVEAGDFESEETRTLVRRFVHPLKEEGADVIVLGCTHYPFLADVIRKESGGAEILEPGPAVAAVCRARLEASGAVREGSAGTETFFVSGAQKHAPVLRRLWPRAAQCPVQELPV